MEQEPSKKDYQEASADLEATAGLLDTYIEKMDRFIAWKSEQTKVDYSLRKEVPASANLHYDNICNTLRSAEQVVWRHRWLYPATSNESVGWMGSDCSSKSPVEIRTVFVDKRDLIWRYAGHTRRMAGLPPINAQEQQSTINVYGQGGLHLGDRYSDFVAAAVGPNSTANNTNIQVWKAAEQSIDPATLVPSLQRVRKRLQEEDPDDEHADERLHVSAAEKAAGAGKKKNALEHLKEAGSWVFEVATKIGEDVAAKAITAAMGLPSE